MVRMLPPLNHVVNNVEIPPILFKLMQIYSHCLIVLRCQWQANSRLRCSFTVSLAYFTFIHISAGWYYILCLYYLNTSEASVACQRMYDRIVYEASTRFFILLLSSFLLRLSVSHPHISLLPSDFFLLEHHLLQLQPVHPLECSCFFCS